MPSREHRLDALAHQERGGCGRFAEAHGEAVQATERFAGPLDRGLGRAARIEPGAVHALEFSVVAGDRGDQRGIAAPAARVRAVRERGMKPQCREPAAVNAASAKVGFGVGGVDGLTAVPQVAGRFGAVVGVGTRRCRRKWLGQEPVRLGECLAQRARAGGQADEVQQVAVQLFGGIRPFPDRARGLKPHEQRTTRRTAHVPSAPVAADAPPVGKIAPAAIFRMRGQRRGGVGRVHGSSTAGTGADVA